MVLCSASDRKTEKCEAEEAEEEVSVFKCGLSCTVCSEHLKKHLLLTSFGMRSS